MAGEPQEIRRINWEECFPFVRLFKAARVALNPTAICLAIVALVATYSYGRLLDFMWLGAGSGAIYGEAKHFGVQSDFDGWRNIEQQRVYDELGALLAETGAREERGAARRDAERDWPAAVDDLYERNEKLFEEATNDAARKKALDRRLEGLEGSARTDAEKKFDEEWPKTVAAERARYLAYRMRAGRLDHRGVFDEFLRHEILYAGLLFQSARMFDVVGNFEMTAMPNRGNEQAARVSPNVDPRALGMIGCLLMMGYGVAWLLTQHFLFSVVFLGGALVIWALLGGAICRVLALQVTQNEAVSLGRALRFAKERWASFVVAPLIPIAAVFVFGLILAAGGLMASIPWLEYLTGPLLSIVFGAALFLGFVIAFFTVGLIVGGALMWPTIAVEGGDAFDPLNRSFSYVYGAIWTTLFYGAVAIITGAFWYLIITIFVWLTLSCTHWFVGIGTDVVAARPELGPGMSKIDALWTTPTLEHLRPSFEQSNVHGWAEGISAFFVNLWVYLLVLVTHAFIIVFYYAASTIAYLLLRRGVDGTDIDDIYPDEDMDEPLDVSPGTETATATAAASATATDTSPPATETPPPAES